MKKILNFIKIHPGLIIFIISSIVLLSLESWVKNDRTFIIVFLVVFYVINFIPVFLYVFLNKVKNFDKYCDSINSLLFLYFEVILMFSTVYLWIFVTNENDIIGFESAKEFNASYLKYSLLVIVDSVHFSIVNTTTLGYGDMLPKSLLAKLVVDFQVLFSLYIVVIGFGRFFNVNGKNSKEILKVEE